MKPFDIPFGPRWQAARLRIAGLRFALAVGLGTVGGAIFFALALPLPWMLGAMTVATGAALAGAPIMVPAQVRNVMIAILGVLLGSQFTIDLFARIAEWYVGLSGVVLSTALAAGMAYVVFRKLGGYDRVTSYFASMPGGLSEMMVLGESMGGDGRTISLTHATRILVAVFLIAFYFRLVEGVAPMGLPVPAGETADWIDIVALIACALIGYPAAKALRVPGAELVGAIVVGAALPFSGIVSAQTAGRADRGRPGGARRRHRRALRRDGVQRAPADHAAGRVGGGDDGASHGWRGLRPCRRCRPVRPDPVPRVRPRRARGNEPDRAHDGKCRGLRLDPPYCADHSDRDRGSLDISSRPGAPGLGKLG
ncbi:MAG: AbrB family transcriptional regulator [Rhodospirillales bacterium]|nr:AbrB family transcriptional regulator [Rhodospirillales bacterium]